MSKTNNITTAAGKSKLHLSTGGLMALLMLVATLGVVFSFVYSRKLVGDILFNNKVISAKNSVNATLKQNLDSVPALKDNFGNLAEDGPQPSEIMEALPLTADYAPFSATLEALSAQAGVQLLAVSLEGASTVATSTEAAPAPTATTVPTPTPATYHVTVVGPYGKLVNMVNNLQLNNRPIRIQKLVFSGDEPEVQAELVITTYYQGLTEIGNQTEVITQ